MRLSSEHILSATAKLPRISRCRKACAGIVIPDGKAKPVRKESDVGEVVWVVIGALCAYILYQLHRAHVLRDAQGEAPPFQAELDIRSLRHEIDGLRDELAHQRAALVAVSQSVDGVRDQIESVTVAQGISPEYNEALVCARRGLDVEAIAERCGISVAEAELVRSLAERQGDADDAER